MQCEICGKVMDAHVQLKAVLIEGVAMKVCAKCESLGTPVNMNRFSSNGFQPRRSSHSERLIPQEEEETSLKPEYGSIIKKKREELGIKQEALAKMISEKESMVHKIESTSPTINVSIARKIEKILKIKILEEGNESAGTTEKYHHDGSLTLGDMIMKKMK
jgi:putative transcription factor